MSTAHTRLLDFNIYSVVEGLTRHGGVSLPILTDAYRLKLLTEAEQYPYTQQPEYVSQGLVREQISSFDQFPTRSLFHELRRQFQKLINQNSELFTTPIDFNDISLQKYAANSIGITAHQDGKSIINVIGVFILKGRSTFALCDDRQGSNPRLLDTTPGNVILLRAPGFLGSEFRPMHFVADIPEERIVFGLRQKCS